ncbi:hypothetical protein KP509_29G017400 [Ceratopteris richardii]|nr:hypothetical protein KP509_29G017400 [Ceratopteris richardii]
MYVKCGDLAKAEQLVYSYQSKDVSSWNALMAGYAQSGQGYKALGCFERMQQKGVSPSVPTFACVLKVCGSIKAIKKGEQIHDEIARQRLFERQIVLGNSLIDMYAKCGALSKAWRVFEELPYRNVVTWNAMIGGYAQHGKGNQALECFKQMQSEYITPNGVTYICVLKACGSIKAIGMGKAIHDEIARQGLLQNDIVLATAVVDMYAKCGELAKAQRVLETLPSRDVISWSALISGYAHQGQGEKALKCFEQMQREGLSPNAFTFACLIQACGSIKAIEKGGEIHKEINRQGLLRNDLVLGTALVDMYAKCGALAKAQLVLEKLPFRDVITWSALITGYIQQGQGEQALCCFEAMQKEGLTPNAVTYACILKACGIIGAVEKGEQIHDEVANLGLLAENVVVLGTALVDMYAKCGSLVKATQVLEELHCQNVVPWNALMTGYTLHGQNEQALKCFEQMQEMGISPNEVTFSCVLNACSRLGLVEKGNMYFFDMSRIYGVKPSLEHFACMVDLFGRAGHLDKAVQVIQKMPNSSHMAAWCALLGACQKWGEVEVGEWAFEQAVALDGSDGAAYVLMGNIYGTAGMYENAKQIELLRNENMAWKQPRSLWDDTGRNLHSYTSKNQLYPRTNALLKKTFHGWRYPYKNTFVLLQHGVSPSIPNNHKQIKLYSLYRDVPRALDLCKDRMIAHLV